MKHSYLLVIFLLLGIVLPAPQCARAFSMSDVLDSEVFFQGIKEAAAFGSGVWSLFLSDRSRPQTSAAASTNKSLVFRDDVFADSVATISFLPIAPATPPTLSFSLTDRETADTNEGALAQIATVPESHAMLFAPVASGNDFTSRLGTLFVLDALFQNDASGVLMSNATTLGDLFILDQLFR